MRLNIFSKKILLLSLLSVIVLFSMFSVSALIAANITIVSPATSGTLSGIISPVNITRDGYDGENWTRARAYLQSAALTANTTEMMVVDWTLNVTTYNWSLEIDTSGIEDGNDYTFKIELWNGTDDINVTRTGLTINNGVPTAPTLSPSTNTQSTSAETVTFTGTVVDANTTSCTYTFYRDGSSSDGNSDSGSGSYSGTSCTFTQTFADNTDNGNYYWTVTASDGTDTAVSATNIYTVVIGGTSGGLAPGTYTTEEGKTFSIAGDGEVSENIFQQIWNWIKSLFGK